MTAVIALLLLGMPGSSQVEPQTFEVKELAGYRLTAAVFDRFAHASRLIATALVSNPPPGNRPLFTEEIAVSGDAPAMAAALQERLQGDPALAGALFAAMLTAREYTKFALALFAARLAHGFVSAGVLRGVPAGVATENVAFVDAHQAEVATVLESLGVRD